MLALSGGALMGPNILIYLAKKSELAAISDLLAKVDPQTFINTFGVPIAKVKFFKKKIIFI